MRSAGSALLLTTYNSPGWKEIAAPAVLQNPCRLAPRRPIPDSATCRAGWPACRARYAAPRVCSTTAWFSNCYVRTRWLAPRHHPVTMSWQNGGATTAAFSWTCTPA